VIRLLTKLSAAAPGEDGAGTGGAGTATLAFRDMVALLAASWGTPGRAPDEYTRILQRLAERSCASVGTRPSGLARPEPIRVVYMSLELGLASEALLDATTELIRDGQLPVLLDALDKTPHAGGGAAPMIWRCLLHPETVRQIFEERPIDFRSFDRLLPRFNQQALEAVFDVVAQSPSRAVRRALLDRLQRLGPDVARLAIRRLQDTRWYVVRNMLALIAELNDVPSGFSATPFLGHADPRVRHEALRILLRRPGERDRALRHVLESERDPGVLWLALATLRRDCPAWARGPLLAIARSPDLTAPVRAVVNRLLTRGAADVPAETDEAEQPAGVAGRLLRRQEPDEGDAAERSGTR
jgi:hypothetical protein